MKIQKNANAIALEKIKTIEETATTH